MLQGEIPAIMRSSSPFLLMNTNLAACDTVITLMVKIIKPEDPRLQFALDLDVCHVDHLRKTVFFM